MYYQTIFRSFSRGTNTVTNSDAGCCDGKAPANTTTDSGWTSFAGSHGSGSLPIWDFLGDWTPVVPRIKVVSSKIILNLISKQSNEQIFKKYRISDIIDKHRIFLL